MQRLSFTEHPASVGESYWQHLGVATGFGVSMIVGGLACLVHAVFPFLFLRTGSATITRLHQQMVVSRTRQGASPIEAAPASR